MHAPHRTVINETPPTPFWGSTFDDIHRAARDGADTKAACRCGLDLLHCLRVLQWPIQWPQHEINTP